MGAAVDAQLRILVAASGPKADALGIAVGDHWVLSS
jgi:hypothetical protein